jgi:hypothetical protein
VNAGSELRIFHLTSDEAAEGILRDGFSDEHATFVDMPGVWVSAPVFDPASLGARKSARLLAIDLPSDALADVEVRVLGADDEPLPSDDRYREWVVPAAVLNRWPVVDLGHPDD